MDVDRGKFLLKEDELMKKENSLAKEKTELAMKRLKKEERKARQAQQNMRTRDRYYVRLVPSLKIHLFAVLLPINFSLGR